MSHTYCSSLFHCVFSTRERTRVIVPDLQERLWAYVGGIARENGMTALAAGGAEDHANILLSLPSSLTIAEGMQRIKSGSSRWLHESCGLTGFEWQKGYGAFSIGCSQVDATVAYIARQKEHHQKRDFQGEFLAILKQHGIEYDPRYVWG
ncbi:MAG: transposase [Terracidiphilus sp.]|jgi:putative transposase